MPERLRAAFYRGGTSKAVVFRGEDLPEDQALRDRIFLHVLGSPDAYGRQLNGMGGGLSSLSKVVIVKPSARDDADVDYTFVQIAVDEPLADYGSACGNMSSCVGPFAVDEGMVAVSPDQSEALVRIYDTNTKRLYHARFPVKGGKAVEGGDIAIPGVSGTGAPVVLDFLAPGGAATGRLLPTGNPLDTLDVDGVGALSVSLVDAANPVVFVRAAHLGKTATELPGSLDGDTAFMSQIERIRCAGAIAMGMAASAATVKRSNPKVAIVGDARAFNSLDGKRHAPDSHDLNVRLVSMGNFHRAITLTGGMCTAVAAQIPGTLVQDLAQTKTPDLRIGTPSGVLNVTARVETGPEGPRAVSAGTYRTQRRIMEGAVLFPDELLEDRN
ncbi:MAG: PrpF family protein [Roseibium sp.]|uniref:PrpF domain-containing protein n=1 Tax=Roseibium sp. TaxID=1936156 RepID=UPI001B172395|nr:PrpF domain-containing protein [Roseibium sp.]MBO6894878.1 PrpF family protein [Roseibium sp.]MBO6930281.1 PrpF family protein [Roseibium sp.]